MMNYFFSARTQPFKSDIIDVFDDTVDVANFDLNFDKSNNDIDIDMFD